MLTILNKNCSARSLYCSGLVDQPSLSDHCPKAGFLLAHEHRHGVKLLYPARIHDQHLPAHCDTMYDSLVALQSCQRVDQEPLMLHGGTEKRTAKTELAFGTFVLSRMVLIR